MEARRQEKSPKKKSAVSLDHFAFAHSLNADIETAEGGARTRDLRESQWDCSGAIMDGLRPSQGDVP